MNSLNTTQKNKVREFRSIVGEGCPDLVLIELLKKTKFDCNSAVEQYFTKGYSEKYAPQSQFSTQGKVND